MGVVVRELDLISREAGYLAEITGEQTIPGDLADTEVDPGPKPPATGAAAGRAKRRPVGRPSETFTDERPASGQHPPARAVNLPLVAVLAGVVAFAVVGVTAAVLITGRVMRGGAADAGRPGPTPAQVHETGPAQPPPDAAADPAAEPPPVEAVAEPPVKTEKTVKPPVKKPPVKKPPVKKPPKEKEKTGDPWTKL